MAGTKALKKCLLIAKSSNYRALMESLTHQLKALKKKEQLEGRPISQHLRHLAKNRFDDIVKEREAQNELQRKAKAADAEQKAKLHEAKTREYLAKQAAVRTEQAWKRQRLQEQSDEKKIKANLKSFHGQIATVVAKYLMNELTKFSPEHGAALKAHVETKEVRNKGKARKNLPFFSCMEAGETVEREIDPKVFRYIGSVTLATDMSKQNCVCSEAFEWLMCKGKRMYQHASGVTGVGGVLKELLDHVCPYYEHVCYPRWSVGTLLTDADYNVDFAFLAGVWRYSHAVGADYFPGGVRQWPPAL